MSRGAALYGQENLQVEATVLHLGGEKAAISPDGVANALESEAVVAVFHLGAHREALAVKLQGLGDGVDNLDDQHLLFRVYQHINDALCPVLKAAHALNGVVQGISEDGVQVHRVHKGQQAPICHAVGLNAVGLAVEALFRQHRIQHLVAGFCENLVDADGLLHLLKILLPLLVGEHQAHGLDLVLEVVAFLVDEGDVFLGQVVLVFLLYPQVVEQGQLLADGAFLKQLVLEIEYRGAVQLDEEHNHAPHPEIRAQHGALIQPADAQEEAQNQTRAGQLLGAGVIAPVVRHPSGHGQCHCGEQAAPHQQGEQPGQGHTALQEAIEQVADGGG